MRAIILSIATLLPFVSSATYIRSILRGKAQPQRMTRLLLMIITGLSTAALFAGGDTSGVWLALASFVQATAIWLLALKRGIGGLHRLDIACLLLCLAGLIWWWTSGDSFIGLVATVAADFVAIVPALHKTVRLPHTEDALFYALGSLGGGLVVAVGPYTWRAMLFPLYIFAIDLVFAVVVVWPRVYARWRHSLY